jgi:translocation and assembly module TamB
VDPDISVKGLIKEGKMFANPFKAESLDSRISLTGSYDLFNNSIEAVVDFKTPDISQLPAPLHLTVSSGDTFFSANISGSLMQPEIKAAMESKNLIYGDIRFGDVLLNVELEKSGRVLIDDLVLDNRGSRIEIKGGIELFEEGFTDLRADMPADLTAILKQVNVPDFYPLTDLDGTFNGRIHLREKITAPAATLSIEASGLAMDETTIGDLASEMTLSGGTLAIDELTLENGNSMIRLSGTVDLLVPGSLSLISVPTLDLVIPESHIFMDDFIDTAGGRITVAGYAKGELSDLVADLSVTGIDLETAGHFVGNLTANAGFAEGRLSIAPLEIVNRRSGLVVTGGIDLFEPSTLDMYEDPAINLKIVGDSIFINDFIQTMGGQLSISGEVEGSIGDPRGNIIISGEQLDLGGQHIESLRVRSKFADKTISFEPAHITIAPGETIRAHGHVSLDNRFGIKIDSDEISVNRIEVLADAGLTGIIRIEAAGEGTIDDPEINGKFFLYDFEVAKNPVEPVNIEFEVKDHTVNAIARSDFTMTAQYHLDSGDFDFHGQFDNTTLDPFLLMAHPRGLSGNLTADIHAEGNASEITHAVADLNIEKLTVLQARDTRPPLELINVAGLRANFEAGRFSIPRNVIALLETSQIEVAGNGHLDGDFEFILEGHVPLEIATAFVPNLQDPEGGIDISGRIFQTAGQPDFNIEIQLHDLGLTVQPLMQKLHMVNGRIRIMGDAVVLEDFTGRLDTGRFTLEGLVKIEEGFSLGQADLVINAHSMPIRVPGTMEVTMNSELKFSGTPDNSLLSGQVILLGGLYYKDFEFSLIGEVTRRRRAAPTPNEMPDLDIPYLRNLALGIDITYRSPLMVDNNVAMMILRPDLHIIGNLNQPGVTGRAEISQGSVSYQNVDFDITTGVIDFIDPYRIHPELDIRAVSEVRTWTINLEVSGTPENIEFKLSSNPPEEHADILALLLLGRTTREVAAGTGPTGLSPEAMLFNLLAGRLEEDIQTGTGLDLFQFEYVRPEVEEDDEALRITIGKELSRRLTVTYGFERKSGETVQQQAAIYKLMEFLSISAFQDTAGTYGGEMRFRLEFR